MLSCGRFVRFMSDFLIVTLVVLEIALVFFLLRAFHFADLD
jgi:hypothetical protein